MKKTRKSGKKRSESVETLSKKNEDVSFSKGSNASPFKKENVLVAATVVGIAYLIALGYQEPVTWSTAPTPVNRSKTFQRSTAGSLLERLSEEWPSGGLVSVDYVDGDKSNRGLFANKPIKQGAVMVAVEFEDLADKINRQYPRLKSMVESIFDRVKKEQHATQSTFGTTKILSILQLYFEIHLGEESTWISYVESLPQNVSSMALYWTDEEKKCVVPRPESEAVFQDFRLFHQVMAELKDMFPPLGSIYNKQKLEWVFLMQRTRGIGHYFLPIFDMANHDPRKAAPPFLSRNKAYFVATQNINAGEQVFNNYGMVSPVVAAEKYGFLDDDPAYFEVPSIARDLLQNEKTKKEPLCNSAPMTFFGNVTEQFISAQFGTKKQGTYFKPYMPSELAYACIRVLLQTEVDTDVAGYISEKMEADLEQYTGMANARHCQSNDGNFPLIRKANQVMARSLREALEVARDGRDWKIAYPDIPTYVKNYPEN